MVTIVEVSHSIGLILRPIVWVNLTIVLKLPGEPSFMVNCIDNRRVEESTVVVEEQEETILPIENTSRMWNCVMRNVESTVVVEEQEDTILPIENINKMWNGGV